MAGIGGKTDAENLEGEDGMERAREEEGGRRDHGVNGSG